MSMTEAMLVIAIQQLLCSTTTGDGGTTTVQERYNSWWWLYSKGTGAVQQLVMAAQHQWTSSLHSESREGSRQASMQVLTPAPVCWVLNLRAKGSAPRQLHPACAGRDELISGQLCPHTSCPSSDMCPLDNALAPHRNLSLRSLLDPVDEGCATCSYLILHPHSMDNKG
jgi:hypothetical protein